MGSGLFRGLTAALCVSLPAVICWGLLSIAGSPTHEQESAVRTPNPAKFVDPDPVSNGLMCMNPRLVWPAQLWKPIFVVGCVAWTLAALFFRGRWARINWLAGSSLFFGLALAWPWLLGLLTPLIFP
ncbi:hypothetical protein [Anatilimnocola floriformis]|uniref:hypothetical protein n=1 Tax=Anatilimnocola floriformis TaxID=2948575 RepID=UPI0020C4E3A9|nr:hypothetical protein [Anatilimnocola floriformis]